MSFLNYVGGKSLLSKEIIRLIPEHQCYCEVFAGAAWVLFKKQPSKVEIINDINTDLVNLYRCVKYHLKEFIRYFEWTLIARDEYDRLKKEDPDTLTDIQRAVRFYYLLRNNSGGKVNEFRFTGSTTRAPKINIYRLEEELSAVHIRLSNVYIENLPYQKIISKYDREHTFFYLDPPYYNCEDYYGKGIFSKDDFITLCEILSGIKGKFLLSLNDTPEVRDIFKNFVIATTDTRYSLGKSRSRNKELFISNYEPETPK